ncbi:MerR family transcriptional regulator [Paractinoplanes lichenicola]|uniref:MerR family transcriptional regulator n=1 Tax=Paractinoplanes lichenicola TaxID=2802976 RepID=A0ABS1VUF1_9ACTN|nr:MerR family transcriptional regulator [Actinoplanes lichenicola]MBL7258058.1 MerR family transcriptional regulator [Actinoplanes lichenicola]
MLIGEVARRSGVSTRMLRHYDRLGLVRPTGRTVGNYREYSGADIRRIFHVESLRSLGLSLKQIAQALEDPEFTPAALVGDLIRGIEERLEREQELLRRLRAVDATRPEGWPDVLRIVELMHGLGSPDAARRQQAVLSPASAVSFAPDQPVSEDVPVPVDLLAGAVLAEADPNVAGALRWALARAGDDGLSTVAAGIHSGDVAVRRRAVLAVAGMPGAEATAVLADALGDDDFLVRGNAAVALGSRGVAAAVPVLVTMIVEGVKDVDAAEALGILAREHSHADEIVKALGAELAADTPVRIRLAQAMVEIPGTEDLLQRLAQDEDGSVALIAAAFLTMRGR